MRWQSVIMNLITRHRITPAGKVGKVPVTFCQYLQKSTGERLFKPWALFKRQDRKLPLLA